MFAAIDGAMRATEIPIASQMERLPDRSPPVLGAPTSAIVPPFAHARRAGRARMMLREAPDGAGGEKRAGAGLASGGRGQVASRPLSPTHARWTGPQLPSQPARWQEPSGSEGRPVPGRPDR